MGWRGEVVSLVFSSIFMVHSDVSLTSGTSFMAGVYLDHRNEPLS